MWNTNPTPDQITALVVGGIVLRTVDFDTLGFEIEYRDGRRLRVEPIDGTVYSERTVDSATINYSIFTPQARK